MDGLYGLFGHLISILMHLCSLKLEENITTKLFSSKVMLNGKNDRKSKCITLMFQESNKTISQCQCYDFYLRN